MKQIIKKILKEETSKRLSQDDPLIKIIKKVVGNEYKDWFTDRWEEERYDLIISFTIPKISMWKVTDEDKEYYSLKTFKDATWEGTIYVEITKIKIIDSEGNVEILDVNDIFDTARIQFENFEEYILDTVAKWIPGAILDVDGNF